ncbi:hypothetical protein [Massilia sp. TS11]|uniref:hypothetical protein n=1 Tax=Massilia sp. TS11 TaxID=2908003 RepID=UPI001EDA6C8F|nr:hypothetical protein [Massilia sp. TS11]MCG2584805.1 hypothetical protein [Massilia sp. TS11]
MKRIVVMLPMLLGLANPHTALAQQGAGPKGGPGPMHERNGPPQEALDACKGKKDGDKATAKTPRGEMAGTCRLVLIPDHPPQQR